MLSSVPNAIATSAPFHDDATVLVKQPVEWAVGLARALTDPFRPGDGNQPLVELIYQKRFLARGPNASFQSRTPFR